MYQQAILAKQVTIEKNIIIIIFMNKEHMLPKLSTFLVFFVQQIILSANKNGNQGMLNSKMKQCETA